jgi:hypothetical protein
VHRRSLTAALVLAGLAGCASCDHVPQGAVNDCNTQIVPGGAATDLLFVIDDSGSMTDNQQALADNLAAFIDALTSSAVALDVRIGVTNTSIDDYNGRTSYGAAANPSGVPYPGPARTPFPGGTIIAIEKDGAGLGQFGHFAWGALYDPAHATSVWGPPRILAGGPDLARDFKANVHQGEWGSGKEQPLRAMELALDASMVTTGANFGFLRSGARLAVVILTDEDDCSESGVPKHVTSDGVCHATGGSTTPIDWQYFDPLDGFVSYLDTTVGALSGEPPIVAAISGFSASGAATGCSANGTSSSANPRRLGAFLDRLEAAHPGRTLKASVCQQFGPTLLQIASMIIPQTMPLRESPQDYRMMAVSVVKAAGVTQPCDIQPAGSASAASAGVIYTPAPSGGLPSLTFQGACRLDLGDRVDLRIVCVR